MYVFFYVRFQNLMLEISLYSYNYSEIFSICQLFVSDIDTLSKIVLFQNNFNNKVAANQSILIFTCSAIDMKPDFFFVAWFKSHTLSLVCVPVPLENTVA